jgi:hypothetical protein
VAYIVPPVTNDPTLISERAFDYLRANLPGWQPSAGNLDVLIVQFFSQLAAEQADIASGVLNSVFRYFGQLVNCLPIDALPATSTATFTMLDNAGYIIPAGSIVGLRDINGVVQGFDLSADLTIAPGSTTGAALVTAETPGVITNGLTGTVQLVQVPGSVLSATMTTPAGGIDAEDDATYLSRLTETLTLLSPRPILSQDFAIIARSIAGVFRATAVDNFKPGPPYDGAAEATGQEKMVTVAVTDVNGLTVGATIRNQVMALLQSEREQNFVVWVVDPTYTTVDVTAAIVAWPSFDLADVQARVNASLANLLSPAVWGTDPTGNSSRWLNDPTLRLSEILAAIMQVSGVRFVSTVTFARHGDPMATTNVTMGVGSAIPALPLAGTFALTVTYT